MTTLGDDLKPDRWGCGVRRENDSLGLERQKDVAVIPIQSATLAFSECGFVSIHYTIFEMEQRYKLCIRLT